jgi:hypothetical protein
MDIATKDSSQDEAQQQPDQNAITKREKLRAYNREYYQQHKAEKRKYNRRYHQQHCQERNVKRRNASAAAPLLPAQESSQTQRNPCRIIKLFARSPHVLPQSCQPPH